MKIIIITIGILLVINMILLVFSVNDDKVS